MMGAKGIITFTTDFGTRDPYTGIMKGIVLSINPDVQLVDITHEIPAHNIISAAFTLAASYAYFPVGTVHIGIVDPGVGGERKNIAIQTEHYTFIGPDNGIFTFVLSKEKIKEIREIKNSPFLLGHVSDTFHGRDVFAPCAAQLSAGKKFSDIGPRLETIQYIEYKKPQAISNVLKGEIVTIDTFGNLITNISKETFQSFVGTRKFEIIFASERFSSIEKNYNKAVEGKPIALFGSSGYLEISVIKGKASSYFMVSSSNVITVRRM